MKRLSLVLLFLVSALSFGQIKIKPVNIGWGNKIATDLMVRVLPFETTDATCTLYYELKDATGKALDRDNITLTTSEFDGWGQSNAYIEDLVLSRLNLQRKDD